MRGKNVQGEGGKGSEERGGDGGEGWKWGGMEEGRESLVLHHTDSNPNFLIGNLVVYKHFLVYSFPLVIYYFSLSLSLSLSLSFSLSFFLTHSQHLRHFPTAISRLY